MININKHILYDEVILFKLNKKRWLIPFLLIFCPLWLLIGLLFIVPCFNNLFRGAISFDSDSTYIMSILALSFLVPLAVLTPISFLLNHLVITDKRIFIRKGIIGKLYIINFSDILAYQHKSVTSRGFSSHFIFIYLKSGKRIKSGNLFIKSDNIFSLLDILNEKIKYVITSEKQHKEFKQGCYSHCCINTKRNILLPIISLSPFVIALIMLVLYVSGINKTGEQMNIEVAGVVVTKSINYDNKHNKISGYDFTVIDKKTRKKYNIPVTDKIYNMFEQDNKVLIKAKKGILGIVYDQWFYTQ